MRSKKSTRSGESGRHTLDVSGSSVLVVEVIGVLPDIAAEEGSQVV